MTILRTKVALVGDAQVGKSALTAMFNNSSDAYPKDYLMTLGVDFCVKKVEIPKSDYEVELYIFDTSGNPIYENIRSSYWGNSNFVIAVYDISSRASFDHVERWVKDIQDVNANTKLKGVLVASKSDLKDYAPVPEKEARALAERLGFDFFECSALTGRNVDAPFTSIAQSTLDEYRRTADVLKRSV